MKDCCKKYSVKRIPRGNCPDCWNRWFSSHLAGVKAAVMYIEKHGEAKAIAGMGSKAYKQMKRFVKEKEITHA